MGKNSVQKVSSGWKKRVKIEYARLRHQKKFRHQDDIRVAWRGNRVAMQASHIKKEVELEKPLENENKEVIGYRAKPIWDCSEVSKSICFCKSISVCSIRQYMWIIYPRQKQNWRKLFY